MEANRKRTDAFLEALQSDSKYECENAYSGEECLIDEVTCSKALDILKEYGATKLVDKVAEVRRTAKSPLQIMNETVGSLIKDKGLPAELLETVGGATNKMGATWRYCCASSNIIHYGTQLGKTFGLLLPNQ